MFRLVAEIHASRISGNYWHTLYFDRVSQRRKVLDLLSSAGDGVWSLPRMTKLSPPIIPGLGWQHPYYVSHPSPAYAERFTWLHGGGCVKGARGQRSFPSTGKRYQNPPSLKVTKCDCQRWSSAKDVYSVATWTLLGESLRMNLERKRSSVSVACGGWEIIRFIWDYVYFRFDVDSFRGLLMTSRANNIFVHTRVQLELAKFF